MRLDWERRKRVGSRGWLGGADIVERVRGKKMVGSDEI
jgi:hypothetical protein